jgi:hypothetical protein
MLQLDCSLEKDCRGTQHKMSQEHSKLRVKKTWSRPAFVPVQDTVNILHPLAFDVIAETCTVPSCGFVFASAAVNTNWLKVHEVQPVIRVGEFNRGGQLYQQPTANWPAPIECRQTPSRRYESASRSRRESQCRLTLIVLNLRRWKITCFVKPMSVGVVSDPDMCWER